MARGLVAVPINAKLHPREFAYILDHSGARAVFVSDDLLEAVVEAAAGLEVAPRLILADGPDYTALLGEPMAMAPVAPRDTARLFYTSGTTGRPKGAMLSHQVLQAFLLSYFADVDTVGPGTASSTGRRCRTARASTCCPTSPPARCR